MQPIQSSMMMTPMVMAGPLTWSGAQWMAWPCALCGYLEVLHRSHRHDHDDDRRTVLHGEYCCESGLHTSHPHRWKRHGKPNGLPDDALVP
jgi:hypothetical protein